MNMKNIFPRFPTLQAYLATYQIAYDALANDAAKTVQSWRFNVNGDMVRVTVERVRPCPVCQRDLDYDGDCLWCDIIREMTE